MSNLKCASCKEYLFHHPMQCPCGDRLCGKCYQAKIKESNGNEFRCSLCKTEVLVAECFRDRAVTLELKKATIQCTSPDCPWKEKSEEFKDHLETCNFAIISCPHSTYGCKEQLPRSEMSIHVDKCQYKPVECKWCGGKVFDVHRHIKNDCLLVPEYCGNGCGEQIARRDVEKHMRMVCPHKVWTCDYRDDGCLFMGLTKDLTKHYKEQCGYHTQLMKKTMNRVEQAIEIKMTTLAQQNSDLKTELNYMKMNIGARLQRFESAICQLHERVSEMALMVQTLQATSYNGVFLWKIPEIQRLRREARIGQETTVSSTPFYTSRHGYKICLRLHLNGDGRGLSFFVTLMRGEHDAFLPWPFKQRVTLMLLAIDPDHVVMSFQPDPTSPSFQRPSSEMNIASASPVLLPLHILGNPRYVKDDTLFMKCKIETLKLSVHFDSY